MRIYKFKIGSRIFDVSKFYERYINGELSLRVLLADYAVDDIRKAIDEHKSDEYYVLDDNEKPLIRYSKCVCEMICRATDQNHDFNTEVLFKGANGASIEVENL